MLCVSWRLLACSRPISSCRLISDSEVTCLSSSIFASSSAIGCSKSRKETAMSGRDYVRRALLRKLVGSAPVGAGDPCGTPGGSGVYHLQRAVADQPLELLDELLTGAHAPLGAQIERAAGGGAGVLDGDRAIASAPGLEDLREPLTHARQLGVRAPEHQALRAARAQLLELADAPRREPPRVAELIETQRSFHQHQRVLHDEVAVSCPGLLEQHDLEPPGAIIERQDDARAALAHLIDQARHRNRPARAGSSRLEARHRPVADQVADAMRDEARQARLEAHQRVPGEVEAERLALAGQPHRLAPLRER